MTLDIQKIAVPSFTEQTPTSFESQLRNAFNTALSHQKFFLEEPKFTPVKLDIPGLDSRISQALSQAQKSSRQNTKDLLEMQKQSIFFTGYVLGAKHVFEAPGKTLRTLTQGG